MLWLCRKHFLVLLLKLVQLQLSRKNAWRALKQISPLYLNSLSCNERLFLPTVGCCICDDEFLFIIFVSGTEKIFQGNVFLNVFAKCCMLIMTCVVPKIDHLVSYPSVAVSECPYRILILRPGDPFPSSHSTFLPRLVDLIPLPTVFLLSESNTIERQFFGISNLSTNPPSLSYLQGEGNETTFPGED